jgi:N-acetylglucosaminyldiphosphoundecaprenol N-acetyl-beta-D-mannosaminyltransferase
MRTKMNILGINMDCLSYRDMHRIFNVWLSNKEGRSHSLALINVNCCVSALFDKRLVNLYNSTDIVGIDGMPFLRWARAFYNKESDRFDGIKVVGKYSPPFRALTPEEDQEVCDMINAVKPDIVWVGLGSPKQDVWISEHREKIRGSILIASGATFDFFSGRIQQAPEWIRNSGFEWLYRLSKDFRRLWLRYTVYNFVFVAMFALQLMGLRRFDPSDLSGTQVSPIP